MASFQGAELFELPRWGRDWRGVAVLVGVLVGLAIGARVAATLGLVASLVGYVLFWLQPAWADASDGLVAAGGGLFGPAIYV